jgi:glycosyltransferase involved in cell wall biosynthesis
MSGPGRIAWFSPLPPVRSGIAADNAALLACLDREFTIDRFVDGCAGSVTHERTFDAHDFVWKNQRQRYDLIVYQLGNAACHDYIWAYLAAYPGLVVLHDPRLQHARARLLLSQKRFDDYRHEFWYDHPDAPRDVVEYAVEGLGGVIYYFWSMLGVVMTTARMVAVHNGRVAADLRDQFPGTPVSAIRLGKAALPADSAARARVRSELQLTDHSVAFAVFGKVTAEKRIGPILDAFSRLVASGTDAALVIAGDAGGHASLKSDLASSRVADRIRVVGYVAEESIGDYLAAADVCLCLRWPTAQETSGSWLQCLAAARPTVITDLAHLVDVPTVDPRTWERTHPQLAPVAIAVDLLDEERSLHLAMDRLCADPGLRADIARAGHAYWSDRHTLDAMADDYRRLIQAAAACPAPEPGGLPAHFLDDHSGLARSILGPLGVGVDVLR